MTAIDMTFKMKSINQKNGIGKKRWFAVIAIFSQVTRIVVANNLQNIRIKLQYLPLASF